MSGKVKIPPMTNLEAHIKSFGQFHYQGQQYVLVSRPYPYVVKDETPYYTADAIRPGDTRGEDGFQPMYNVRWPINDQHQVDYCLAKIERDSEKAMQISMEWGIDDDTVNCDWDSPFSVYETMYKYSIDEFCKRYEWS